MKRARLLATLAVVGASVLGVFGAAAYASTTADTTAPVTTSDALATYTGDAVINLTATDDAGGWGVAYIYYKVDGHYTHMFTVGATAATSVPIAAPKIGSGSTASHTISYWSQDKAGNVEVPPTTKNFRITAAKVVTSLTLNRSASTVHRNHYFTLSGKITPSAVCLVVIQYKKPGTTTWRTLAARSTTSGGAYSCRYRTTVKGTWSFRTRYTGTAKRLGSHSRILTVRVR